MFSQFCNRKRQTATTYPGTKPTSNSPESGKHSTITITRHVRGKVRNRCPRTKENGADNSDDSHSHHSESSADDESHSSLVSVRAGLSKCCVQGTLASRRWQMFQMVFLPFIPITALIVQNSTQLSTVVTTLREATETKQQVSLLCFSPISDEIKLHKGLRNAKPYGSKHHY